MLDRGDFVEVEAGAVLAGGVHHPGAVEQLGAEALEEGLHVPPRVGAGAQHVDVVVERGVGRAVAGAWVGGHVARGEVGC